MSAIPLPVNADSGATGNDETDIAMSSTHQPPLQLSAYDTSVGQSIGFTPLFHNPAILQDFQDMEAIAAADAYFDHQDYQDSQMGMLGPEDIVAPWSFISTVNNFTLNHSSNTPQDIEPEADVTEADMMEAQQIAWFGDMMNDVGASTPSAFSGHTPSAHMLTQQTQQIQEGQGQLAISADQHAPPHATSEDQNNLSLGDFLYSWAVVGTERLTRKRKRGPNLSYVQELRSEKLKEIKRSNLRGQNCDIQGLDWKRLEVSRSDARLMRAQTYRSYVNLTPPPSHRQELRKAVIDDSQNYFKFRRMDFTQKINYAHFQLRNLVACTSRNNIFYAGDACVYQYHPLFGKKAIRMDLSDPIIQPTHSTAFSGVIVSTLAAEYNVLIAGGYFGEYAMSSLDSTFETPHTEGLVTDCNNAITNHIQITLNRHSGSPEAIFCSNDNGLRILDCTTNQFVTRQEFAYPINCSAVSPDYRLRAIVGDSRNVMICNAETGEVLQELDGHEDYGFACAWSDNGWNVATGNQDRMVKIWDARMWTDKNGRGKPIKSIASSMAGVRSLRYSPVGSGKRVLIAAEQGDNFSIIDAETYRTKQEFDFFGEILGIALTPDGQDLFVGVHDSLRGGMMEFEKCGFGELYEQPKTYHRKSTSEGDFYDDISAGHDWKRTIQDVVAHPKSRRTATHRRRRAANLGEMDPF